MQANRIFEPVRLVLSLSPMGIQKQLAAEFPSRPEFRRQFAASHTNRGVLLRNTGRPQAAE